MDQPAPKVSPAVVSVVIQHQPAIVHGSGYLATSDGYIVTSINTVAGASGMTVLVPGDSRAHDARLVDYDCQTGAAGGETAHARGPPQHARSRPHTPGQSLSTAAPRGPP